MADEKDGLRSGKPGAADGVTYLEGAHWQRLLDEKASDPAVSSWIALQCSLIDQAKRGLVVARRGGGPFRPVAFWPEEAATSRFLMSLVNKALTDRLDIIQEDAERPDHVGIARLVRQDGRVVAVVGLEIAEADERRRKDVLRQVQWGSAWLEVFERRVIGQSDDNAIRRLTMALDAVAIAGEQRNFRAAAAAALTSLSVEMKASRITFGTRGARGIRVRAMSNITRFDRRVTAVRDIGAAMDEAFDQLLPVQAPGPEDGDAVIRKRTEHLRQTKGSHTVLVQPFARGGRGAGAFVFEWPASTPPEPHILAAAADIAAVLGPVLDDMRREERWLAARAVDVGLGHLGRLIGPGYMGRKIAVLCLAAITAFLVFYKTDFRVTADARLRGAVERLIVAPLDGFVQAAPFRAGDRVSEGDTLAKFDDVEYQLERYLWVSRKQQFQAEYAQALAEFDRAGVNILRARLEEAEAQIVLNETRIALTNVTAPFDGVVVSGDLSQSLGQSMQRGTEVFRITPLDSYIVEVEVPESDVLFIDPSATGRLVLTSLPTTPLEVSVTSVTPVTRAADGINSFLVEMQVTDAGGAPVSPGMEGIVKIDAGEAAIGWIWTRRVVDWVRLTLWKWAP